MKRWPRRISPRRAAFGGTLCLILGAVTTVGVAWWAATDGSSTPLVELVAIKPRPGDKGLADVVYAWDGDSASRIVWVKDVKTIKDQSGLAYEDRTGRGVLIRYRLHDYELQGLSSRVIPRWSLSSETRSDTPYVVEQATGWPALSLYSRTESDQVGVFRGKVLRWGITVPPSDNAIGANPSAWLFRALPYRPLLPGFLINTLFYAALWFGLFFAIGRTRRFIRTRRGRCPRCGYDLRGELNDGCSECGWRRGSAVVRRDQS